MRNYPHPLKGSYETHLEDRKLFNLLNYCPGKEAAMGIIVASHSCTTHHWGTLIVL